MWRWMKVYTYLHKQPPSLRLSTRNFELRMAAWHPLWGSGSLCRCLLLHWLLPCPYALSELLSWECITSLLHFFFCNLWMGLLGNAETSISKNQDIFSVSVAASGLPRSEALKTCGNRGGRRRSHKLATFTFVEWCEIHSPRGDPK